MVFSNVKVIGPAKNSAVLVCLFVMLGVIALNVSGYGYWRHDAWSYTRNELHEFRENGRWLSPMAHHLFREVPNFVAWCLSIGMAWWYAFFFSRRFFDGTGTRLATTVIPFLLVLQPGLMEQLNWPNHTLAAVSILLLVAAAFRKKGSLAACALATILTFGILQSFSFAPVLMAIPSLQEARHMSRRGLIRRLGAIWITWILSFVAALLVARVLQVAYFGEVPEFPAWRLPDPARDIFGLIDNLFNNFLQFSSDLFRVYGAFTVLILLAGFYVASMSWRSRDPNSAIMSVWLFVTGIALMASMYVVLASHGFTIALRTTFNFGFGMVAIGAAAWAAALETNEKWLSLATRGNVILLAALPGWVSYNNTAWFAAFTEEIVSSIEEIEPEGTASRIVINLVDDDERWVPDFNAQLFGTNRFMEGLGTSMRIVPAFRELGYRRITRCRPDDIREICRDGAMPNWRHCSDRNPDICSAGIRTGIWYITID